MIFAPRGAELFTSLQKQRYVGDDSAEEFTNSH